VLGPFVFSVVGVVPYWKDLAAADIKKSDVIIVLERIYMTEVRQSPSDCELLNTGIVIILLV
jgi:hypothetical protein